MFSLFMPSNCQALLGKIAQSCRWMLLPMHDFPFPLNLYNCLEVLLLLPNERLFTLCRPYCKTLPLPLRCLLYSHMPLFSAFDTFSFQRDYMSSSYLAGAPSSNSRISTFCPFHPPCTPIVIARWFEGRGMPGVLF